MTTYKLQDDGSVKRSDGVTIPSDQYNRDYLEFLAWVEVGNAPEPAEPTSARELTLSPSQQIILADGVDAAVIVVAGEPGATIDFTVNGEPQNITLDESGVDKIELTCDTPSTTLLVQSGSAKAVIYAVEVPA
jgi:hypothetical protein